jgi:trk system potassium uptake protein TrkA
VAQFAVIGIGNFGFYLAVNLYKKGHEVLVIDSDQSRIQEIKDLVNQAVVADATDREALKSLGLDQVDAAVVSIGTDIGVSILTTLNLKEIGTRRILSMAVSEPHGRVLQRLGVSEVLFPEKDMAASLADKLHNPNMIEYIPFVEGYGIIELAPPQDFVGKTLKELDLINRHGVQVLAVKETVPDQFNLIPTAQFVLKDSDILILLGPSSFLDKLKKEVPRLSKSQSTKQP